MALFGTPTSVNFTSAPVRESSRKCVSLRVTVSRVHASPCQECSHCRCNLQGVLDRGQLDVDSSRRMATESPENLRRDRCFRLAHVETNA